MKQKIILKDYLPVSLCSVNDVTDFAGNVSTPHA